MNQIEKFNMCRKFFTLFNKGIQNCKKPKHIVNSVEDSTDSFYTDI